LRIERAFASSCCSATAPKFLAFAGVFEKQGKSEIYRSAYTAMLSNAGYR
jgi:hypothetical protein